MNYIPGVIRYDRKDRVIGQVLRFYQHQSGFRIDLVQKRGYKNKYAAFLVPYGAEHVRYEEDGMVKSFALGTPHFVEHMLLSSVETSGPLYELTKLGVQVDATTSNNQTLFSFSAAEHFEEALVQLTNVILRPDFSEEVLVKERDIIQSELFMYKEDVSTVASQILLRNMYESMEIHEDILGNSQTIRSITRDDIKRCYQLLYHPSNMTLILVGNFSEPEEETIVTNIASFLDMYCPKADSKKKILHVKEHNSNILQTFQQVELPSSTSSFWIGYKKPISNEQHNYGGKELIRARIAGNLVLNMFLGPGSTLFDRLYTDGLLDESLTLNYVVEQEYAYVTIAGDSLQPEKVCDRLCQQLEEYIRLGAFDDKRMNELMRSNIGTFLRDMDDLTLLGEAVAAIRRNNMEFSDYASIFEQVQGRELLDELSFIKEEQRAIVVVHGKEKGM